jgi:g-D-glutamyl-meso-diaminopimelate peptidase
MEKKSILQALDKAPMDHKRMMQVIEALCVGSQAVGYSVLGHSILGKEIPILSLGSGKDTVLYVGAHHGMEWLTSILLLRFVLDICGAAKQNTPLYGISVSKLLSSYTIHVVPMLNPDGVEYQIHGVGKENPLRERLICMNGGSEDFSSWQANARGVDLNHNYDAGFEEYKLWELQNGILGGKPTRYSGECPESEPEIAYLCGFIRFQEELKGVLTLHTQGEEIFYRSGNKNPPEALRIAQRLAVLCGYRLSLAEGPAAYGGLTDWCIQKMERPSFTLECGKGKNPLPLSQAFPIYAHLRKALFLFPTLLGSDSKEFF